jgi:hypothetical protein
MSKNTKQWAIIELLMHENETPIRIHLELLAFYGEDDVNISTVPQWVRKSLVIDRNLDQNDQM